jgi:hypothetical protein
MRSQFRPLALAAIMAMLVAGSFTVLQSSQAIFVSQTDNAANLFGTAPSFEDRTYYLHDEPTPPLGDTSARLLLTADHQVPTAQTLYNYSIDLDTDPGRHLDQAGYDKNRTDPSEAVAWRLPPVTDYQHLVGGITVDYWVAQDGFTNGDETKIKWFLRDFDPASGTYTEIEEIEFKREPLGPSGAWVHVTTVFEGIDYLLAPGHIIELKAEANHANANLAYDTVDYPSFVVFPEALDIAVTGLEVVTPFGVGELVTVRAEIVNQGADGTTFDLVLTDLTSGQVLDTVSVAIAVFETQTIDLTWDSAGAALGKHNLQVEAVVPGDIDPGDNTRTKEVDVKVPKHDVALGGLDAPGHIGQGGQLGLSIDVENKGNRTETFDLVLTDTTTGLEIERRSLTLGIGLKVKAAFSWNTAGVPLGPHVLRVEAVVAGDANPGDNVKTKTVTVEAPVLDLAVKQVTAPSPVGVGEQVLVDVQVENKGNLPTFFDLVLRDTTAGVVVETQTVELAQDVTAWFQFVWDTSGGSVGDHVLGVEAVVAGDANPGDNVKTKTVTLNSVVYDLKVANVTAPSPVGVGEQVLVDVQVENRGNIATTFDLVLRDTTAGVVVETQMVSLARAETAWFQFVWDTSGGSVGDHVLGVEAVVAGDANPGDNVKTKTVTLNSVVYDLKVANVTAPSPVVKGALVSVVIDVENKGNIATTFNLVLRDTTDNMIVETRTVTVARGSVATFTFEWDTTAVSLGVHVLESEAMLIGDANPGDNKKTKDVTVNA